MSSSPSWSTADTASCRSDLDYVASKNLPTARNERIQVQLVEVDEIDGVLLVAAAEEDDR